MAWTKGQSGNPKGRALERSVFRNLCQRDVYRAYNVLMEIMENREYSEAARVQAAKFHLESGFGKPQQSISFDLNVEQGDARMMTQEELLLAAEGKMEELAYSLFQSGKLSEYMSKFQGVPLIAQEAPGKTAEEAIAEEASQTNQVAAEPS